MAKNKKPKFKCTSEAQKKAIRRSYAIRASKGSVKKGKNSLSKVVKRKNPPKVKDKIPLGRTLSTYDNYLPFNPSKPSFKERPVVVIEVNDKDEMAVVPLSSRKGKNRTDLPNYQQGLSKFKHFVEIEDNEGQPIVLGEKFRSNSPELDVSSKDVKTIIDVVFEHSSPAPENKLKIEKFRSRYSNESDLESNEENSENKKSPRD